MLLHFTSWEGLLTHESCLNGLTHPNATQTSGYLEHCKTYTDAHYGIFSVSWGIKGNSNAFQLAYLNALHLPLGHEQVNFS